MMNQTLILGSKSPRRKQLLEGLGFPFEIRTADTDESFSPLMCLEEVPEFLARKKFNDLLPGLNEKELLITADTTVIIGDEILNKPSNFDEAKRMLKKLSGNMHKVITGVCIGNHHKIISLNDKTKVYFNKLSDSEINYYIENHSPYDKAGSYGIQEYMGYIGIQKIEGCFYNVMGLPIGKVYQTLKRVNYQAT